MHDFEPAAEGANFFTSTKLPIAAPSSIVVPMRRCAKGPTAQFDSTVEATITQ